MTARMLICAILISFLYQDVLVLRTPVRAGDDNRSFKCVAPHLAQRWVEANPAATQPTDYFSVHLRHLLELGVLFRVYVFEDERTSIRTT